MFPVEFADCVPALTGQGANTLCQNGLAVSSSRKAVPVWKEWMGGGTAGG